MQPADRERFSKCLLACSEIYGREVSPAVMGVWWAALGRFEMKAIESAFGRHMQSPDTGQFMPKPADIIRMLEGTSLDSSMVAWSKVDKAIRNVGPYRSVVFDDAIIHRVLHDMGGWTSLSTKTDDEWPFVGNEFRNRYQGYRSRGELPEYQPRLLGLAEAENQKLGIPQVHETVFIGDEKAALAVLKGGTDKPLLGITKVSDASREIADRVLEIAHAKGSS